MSKRGARLVVGEERPLTNELTFDTLFSTGPYPGRDGEEDEDVFDFLNPYKPDLEEWSDIADGVQEYKQDGSEVKAIRFRSVTWARARPWIWVRVILCCFWFANDVKLTKATWLRILNGVCALVHMTMMILCLDAGSDKNNGEMEVPLWRTTSRWEHGGADGYTYNVIKTGSAIRIDYLTASFFALSFAFHAAATLLTGFDASVFYYWRQLDLGFCYWRCARV